MDFEVRKVGAPQGRRKLVREREEYFRLMDQGLSSYEACRIVGINYRTGKRWRNGRQRKTLGWGTPAERLHKLLTV